MREFIDQYLNYMPLITFTDIIEIILISCAIYFMLRWIQRTKAWELFKGLMLLAIFYFFVTILRLNTIAWILNNALSMLVIVVIVVFQPELRKALEELGKKNLFTNLFYVDDANDLDFSEKTVDELVEATVELSGAKTGALIVVEKTFSLKDYEQTGIKIDAIVGRSLLINIFEHNTPLHDGAVLIRGNRIMAATCYLPLSDNRMISKALGTRHRAAIGLSEVSDAFILVVSEETGKISFALEGRLYRSIDSKYLRSELMKLSHKSEKTKRFWILKGRKKNEKKIDE